MHIKKIEIDENGLIEHIEMAEDKTVLSFVVNRAALETPVFDPIPTYRLAIKLFKVTLAMEKLIKKLNGALR